MTRIAGIYVITDVTAGKAYVGSSVNLRVRLNTHARDLKKGTHANYRLQKAHDKGHRLTVLPIPVEDGLDVCVLEQKLLDEYADSGLLYNIAKDASAPMLGRTMSDEAKEKMRIANTGFRHTPETLVRLSENAKARGMPRSVIEAGIASRVGKSLSPEHIEKVRASSIERMQDPTRRKLSGTSMLGKKHSPETIAKMKEKCAGRTFSPQAQEARKIAMEKKFQQLVTPS